jgi:hypothetical protein
MAWSPKTEEQLALNLKEQGVNKEFELFHPGIYDYEIVKAENKISKSNKEMLYLFLKISANNGRVCFVHDYLMLSPEFALMEFKLRHFFYSCGAGEMYEKVDIHPDLLIGRGGRLTIKIEKDKRGQYPDKNAVRDYEYDKPVESKKNEKDSASLSTNIDLNDDIPF